MRRQDRQTSDEEAIDLMVKGQFGILSMCSPDLQGYGVPLSYVFDSGSIYFHCAKEGTKLDYIRNNSKVSFCVVGEIKVLPSKFGTLYSSAIANGEIVEIDGPEKREALMLFIRKYSPDFLEGGAKYTDKLYDRVTVLKLLIKSITGKSRKY